MTDDVKSDSVDEGESLQTPATQIDFIADAEPEAAPAHPTGVIVPDNEIQHPTGAVTEEDELPADTHDEEDGD